MSSKKLGLLNWAILPPTNSKILPISILRLSREVFRKIMLAKLEVRLFHLQKYALWILSWMTLRGELWLRCRIARPFMDHKLWPKNYGKPPSLKPVILPINAALCSRADNFYSSGNEHWKDRVLLRSRPKWRLFTMFKERPMKVILKSSDNELLQRLFWVIIRTQVVNFSHAKKIAFINYES